MPHQKHQFGDYVNYALLGLISLAMIFPFFYVFSVSLTDPDTYVQGEFILIPKDFSLAAYKFVLGTSQLWNSLQATVFITVVGTILNLFFTMTFAYVLTKKNMPGWKFFTFMVLLILFFNAGLIPSYLLVKELGLMNSLWALILPGLTNPWALFVVRSFYTTIPSSLEEAAYIDGCGVWQAFWRITLPLSAPGLAATAVLCFIFSWNDFFYALILTRTQAITAPVAIVNFLQYEGWEWAKIAASGTLVMFPVIVFTVLVRTYLVRGLTAGGVKD